VGGKCTHGRNEKYKVLVCRPHAKHLGDLDLGEQEVKVWTGFS